KPSESNEEKSFQGEISMSEMRQGRKRHVKSVKQQKIKSFSCWVKGTLTRRFTEASPLASAGSGWLESAVSAQFILDSLLELLSVLGDFSPDRRCPPRGCIVRMQRPVTVVRDPTERELDVVAQDKSEELETNDDLIICDLSRD